MLRYTLCKCVEQVQVVYLREWSIRKVDTYREQTVSSDNLMKCELNLSHAGFSALFSKE